MHLEWMIVLFNFGTAVLNLHGKCLPFFKKI
jgi:hypothetical protein